MNLQPLFMTVVIAAFVVAIGAGIVGTYARIRIWRDGLLSPYYGVRTRSRIVFFCAWAVIVGAGLLASKLGYQP